MQFHAFYDTQGYIIEVGLCGKYIAQKLDQTDWRVTFTSQEKAK